MARMPDPIPGLIKRIAALESAQNRKQNSSPFFGTGMHPTGDGGMQSDDFDGDLTSRDAGTMGWAHDSSSAAFGDLILRPGIIGNDSLTSPVAPDTVWEAVTGFSVGTAWSTIISKDVTVPAGFTRLHVMANGRVTAFYNNAGTGSGVDYLYSRTWVGSNDSGFYPLAVTDNGGSGTNQTTRAALIEGLTPGSTVTFKLDCASDFANWTSPSGNKAVLGAILSWLR